MEHQIKAIAHLPEDVQVFLEAVAYCMFTESATKEEGAFGRNVYVLIAAESQPYEFACAMTYASKAISPRERETADPTALLSAIRQWAENILEDVRARYRLPDEDVFGPDENGVYPTEDEKNAWREEVRLEQEADRKAAREAA